MSGGVGPSAAGGALPSWWKVCFVYGDQTKVYRKLYGRKSQVRSLKCYNGDLSSSSSAVVGASAVSSGVSDGDQDSM
jgi:hypothetical protein